MRTDHRMIDRVQGQVLILFALSLFVLMGVMALALDVGYLLSERRSAQTAADAGALAGARRLMSGDGVSPAASDALKFVEANDISLSGVDSGTAAVTINGDKTNGTVTVDVTAPVVKFFVGAIYTGDWRVTAHAVAEINDNANGQFALVALEEPGMSIVGAPRVEVIGGGAFSNGDVARSGQANSFTVGTTIDAVGTVNEGNLWSAEEGFHDNRPTMDDPLADAIPPDPTTLVERDAPDCWNIDCVLEPGYYANMNIEINQTATLSGGLYYFYNTTVWLQDSDARIEGNGVMLYFDGSTASFEPRTGAIYLTAPASSPYAGGVDGMTVWIANCSDFDSQGNQEFYIEGIFYAPCSDVWMHGNPNGVAVSGQVIVGTLDIRGDVTFVAEYVDYVHTPRIGVFLIE